jgi:toxin-antitoxin system PIN domain toxin
MRALLDINVLIALIDANHVHHRIAREWLEANIDSGWASCPLTQNGFVRIISQAAYPNRIPLSEAARRLLTACKAPHHQFWPDQISILDPARFVLAHIHGPRQITDAYLLALAVENEGRFVTFDGRIPVNLCPRSRPENLVQL